MDAVSAKLKLILLLALRRRRNKRWWVRPIFERRLQQGDAGNLIEEMRLNDIESFFNYFRMTPSQFDELLALVGPSIQKRNSNFRQSIPEKDRLAVTLRYVYIFFAKGDLMTSLSFAFRMGKPTVSLIIRDTCAALCNVLQPTVLEVPSEEKWLRIAQQYETLWQFPHCLGSIDGKHVIIQAPPRTGSTYYNYKGSFSIVLMAVADAKYKFIIVDIGAASHQSDGGIFINSTFGKALDEEALNLPKSSPVRGSQYSLPYIFIGDEAFSLKSNLMRPYPGRELDTEKYIFNYRLSRARRYVENTFQIMAARFRILRKPIVAGLTTSQNIVKSSSWFCRYG
ncbi:protein ALP1-like [Stegodyphus dumicola]|uniref:protein ALP1-like n=1 Tax=Stegodyphus dumicola TaxID=202533 RepID=UPI0015A7E751|nr:protein ALP1-like [Stegodyphus dumicola]